MNYILEVLIYFNNLIKFIKDGKLPLGTDLTPYKNCAVCNFVCASCVNEAGKIKYFKFLKQIVLHAKEIE